MTKRKRTDRARARSGHGEHGPDRFTLVIIAVVVVGLAMALYPAIANWWNGRHMDDASASYEQQVSATQDASHDDALKKMWKAAVAYNKTLVGQGDRYHLSHDEMREYLSLLDPSHTGVMGQVEIPKIGLDLPIYHTTENEVLAEGIGHIPGSSLPVGGASTHCVISGHRAFPGAELFTNIDQLTEGDTFELHVLGRTLTYQVDQIRIVLPDQVNDLAIVPGEDLCTLVTCTPYGINTHRLLVRGHRVPNVGVGNVDADATAVDSQTVAIVLVVALLAAAWAAYLAHEHASRARGGALERVREKLQLVH